LTPTAGNQDVWTISLWYKRANVSTGEMVLFNARSGSDDCLCMFEAGDTLRFFDYTSGSYNFQYITTQLFRDPGAWGHLVFGYNSADGTAADRVKIWHNGVRITAFSTETTGDSARNTAWNQAIAHAVGRRASGAYFDGYIAEFVHIEDSQLDADQFGETDDQGNWVPIKVSGLTFGSEGFHLDFADSSDFGNDVSGNNNDFTDSGLAANDQVPDSPTDDADNDVGNYCTWNAVGNATTPITLSDGNLTTNQQANGKGIAGTIYFDTGTSTGFYWEITQLTAATGEQIFGLAFDDFLPSGTKANSGIVGYKRDGNKYDTRDGGDTSSSYGSAISQNDVIGVAVKNGKVYFSLNGTYQNSSDPVAETGGAFTDLTGICSPMAFKNASAGVMNNTLNCGQQTLNTAAPTGYKLLNTANLPAPAIKDPSKYFQVDTFTGTGSELVRTLTDAEGGAVKPDLVWIKDRDTANQHVLTDSARGATKEWNADNSDNETTVAQGLKSFNASGYTLGTDGNYNGSSSLNVAWCWSTQGGAGSSNTDGSINTTTTSVGVPQGFSISTFVGTGANATVGHGLGVAPEFMILKNRTTAGRDSAVYHALNTSAPETDCLVLNESAATVDDATKWNDTAPTTSVFSVGTADHTNKSGANMVAYCWAGVEGYSKFGSFVGNASTDGPVVFTNMAPKFVLIKNASAVAQWYMYDFARDTYNAVDNVIYADATNAEFTGNDIDFLSNGFKIRATGADTNGSGNTFIYAAFAEFPFGGDGVSQARAR
jgi:hypothetical protein